MKGQKQLFSKGKDDWRTPPAIITRLEELEGRKFDLDAAADATSAVCSKYFGPGSPEGEDSLVMETWGDHQLIWLNPPYSLVKEFVAKAYAEAMGRNNIVYLLVPARTDTRWFHTYIWDANVGEPHPGVRVDFLKGRLKFLDPAGKQQGPAPFPSMLVRMG